MSSLTKKRALGPKFLLDENIDIGFASFLKEKGFFVLLCPKGLTNGAVIKLAKTRSLILVTNDKDFANMDIYKPENLLGIVVFRIHPPKLKSLITAFNKLLNSIPYNKFSGKTFIVAKKGVEILSPLPGT